MDAHQNRDQQSARHDGSGRGNERQDAHDRGRNSSASYSREMLAAMERVAVLDAGLEQRELGPSDALAPLGDGRIRVAGQEYRFDPAAFCRLCKTVGAPTRYLQTLKPGLKNLLLRVHIDTARQMWQAHPERGSYAALLRGRRFIGLLRSDLYRLPGRDVLQAVLEGVGQQAEDLTVYRLHLDDASFEIELISTGLCAQVRADDVVRAGLRINHSLAEDHATRIEPYIVRLVCSNGMTRTQCGQRRDLSRTRRLPANDRASRHKQMDQLRRLSLETWSGLSGTLDALRRARDERVNVPSLLDRFTSRARIRSRRLMSALQQAWQQDGAEPTAYAAVNALTWVGTHNENLSMRQRRLLQSLAGILVHRAEHLCPRCFSILTQPLDSITSLN